MVWLSGGPGCSSQLALLAENGPCVPNEDGSDTISNKWSWTNKANVIWVRKTSVWQYSLWSFSEGGTKLERFLHKNQHTQMKVLNFEFWINDKLSKIGHYFSNKVILKLILSRNVNNQKCAPKLVFFNENKIEKYSDGF